jgi:hypothetical protein
LVGGTLGTSTTANGIFGGGGIGTGGCVPTIAPANGQIQYTGFQQAGIYPAGTSATLICLSGLFQLIFGHSFVYSFLSRLSFKWPKQCGLPVRHLDATLWPLHRLLFIYGNTPWGHWHGHWPSTGCLLPDWPFAPHWRNCPIFVPTYSQWPWDIHDQQQQ